MQSKAALGAEIEQVISPFTISRDGKPPYSTSEVMVMATVCSDSEWVAQADILRWIFRTFPFYADKALEEYTASDQGLQHELWDAHGYRRKDTGAVTGLYQATHACDMPFETKTTKVYRGPWTNKQSVSRHRVDVSAAWLFPRELLEPKREGTFPFMELPAELRHDIYGMLFTPGTGRLQATYYKGDPILKSQTGANIEAATSTEHTAITPQRLPKYNDFVPTTSQLLAPLLVSKQFYREAMPFFYRDNVFDFSSVEAFGMAIGNLAPARLEHLSQLNIDLGRTYAISMKMDTLINSLKALTGVKHLKRLSVHSSNDDQWLKMSADERRRFGANRSRTYTKVAQISFFPELARVGSMADEFVVTGDCPKIRAYLEAEESG